MEKVISVLLTSIIIIFLVIIAILFIPEFDDGSGETNLTLIEDNLTIIALNTAQIQYLDNIRNSGNRSVQYIDSDGGFNPYLKGVGQGGKSFEDVCFNSRDLLEHIQTADGGGSGSRVECAAGCQNGACIDTRDRNKCVKLRNGEFNLRKINLIFAGLNFDNLESFRKTVDFELAINKPHTGFFSIEPFRSNLKYFDIYYINNIAKDVNPEVDLYRYGNNLVDNCVDIPRDDYYYPIILIYDYLWGGGSFTIPRISYAGFKEPINISSIEERKRICEDVKTNIDAESDECERYIRKNFIIGSYIELHEFGHSFGNLLDEYSGGQSDVNISGELNYVNANCFRDGDGTTEQACLLNANWKDLIGDGCGQEGVIDCSEEDTDYIFEVGCFEGCMQMQNDVYRSTRASLMRHEIPASQVKPRHILGLPNERQFCCQILTKTGSVTGFCNEFNKNGNLISYCMENTFGLTNRFI